MPPHMQARDSSAPVRPTGRLPLSLSAFIGRRRELTELASLLASHRLITLVGAAGSGKTRLAAEAVREEAVDAVWIELGALPDGRLVAGQVAALLGIREHSGDDPVATLVATIGDRRVLLVLDNCEHVIEACAELVERLLRECSHVRVLATSRQALGIGGEKSWQVPPLALPVSGAARFDDVVQAEAVQLFAQRAADVVPGFAVTPTNSDAVVRICRQLDGLPLAIELAAARVKMLPPEQLVRRLDDVFAILTSSTRTTLPRHRTLRALLDWSYDLLEPAEQRLLRRLSVFAGGFTLDAAESIPSLADVSSCDVLDLLAALVDRSLVAMHERDGEARYTLLETVRQYAQTRLRGEESDAARSELAARHAQYYLELADAAAAALHGTGQLRALSRLDAEHDNLRAALTWSISQNDVMLALNLCRALGGFWTLRGHHTEGRRWIDDALRVGAPTCGLAAHAMTLAGTFARMHGEHDVARALHAHAVQLARDAGDARALAEALVNLGSELTLRRDLAPGRAALDEAVQLRRELGTPWALSQALSTRAGLALAEDDPETARALRLEAADVSQRAGDRAGEARALVGLGEAARLSGDWDSARAYNERAIALFRQLGETWHMSAALHNLGWIAAVRGDLRASLAAFDEFFQLFIGAGNRRIGAGLCLAGVSYALHARGDAELAARALGTAQRAFAGVGIKPAAADQKQWDATRDALRATLGAAAFERAWTQDLPGDPVGIVTELLARARALCEADAEPATSACVPDSGCEELCGAEGTQEPESAPRSGGPDLRVQSLGPLRVYRGDEQMTTERWGSARPRELLLYLLCATDGRTREQVGVDFWPESTTAQVRNSFHVTLYRLRKALGHPEWVTLDGDRYRISRDITVAFDAAEFERGLTERLRAARSGDPDVDAVRRLLALYQGDFLEDEATGSWAGAVRDRLSRLYRDGLLALGDILADRGAVHDAADAFRKVIAHDDLHEPAYRRLMECLVRTGQRAEALRLYQRLCEVLRAELGIAPDPETTALHARLLREVPA
jgi:predicted ATPase/DNA-binding SARP family transcriptional activator